MANEHDTAEGATEQGADHSAAGDAAHGGSDAAHGAVDAAHGADAAHFDPMHQFQINRLIPVEIGGIDISFTNSSLFMVIAVALISIFIVASTCASLSTGSFLCHLQITCHKRLGRSMQFD